MDFLSDLKWRGLVKDISNETKFKNAQLERAGLYCGFDPTAASLHVGHLIPITILERAHRFGLKPIALLGGGTGMIGDPSFKSKERILLPESQVDNNVKSVKKQLQHLVPSAKPMNNKDWLGELDLIDFLRGVGKEFSVNYLLAKEAISKRLTTGLSMTEFLYPILQAYDFYWLYKHENCHLEVGGSDQWGNITSGLDFIRNQVGEKSQAAGLTVPLLLQKNGHKFGKTASGNIIWLDSKRTSPYNFYQFWLNQSDEDARQLLKFLTFLSEIEIKKIIELNQQNPRKRLVQLALAQEMTLFVHGKEGLKEAEALTVAFFQGTIHDLDERLWNQAIHSLTTTVIEPQSKLIDAFLISGVVSSKREAREFIRDQAISINGKLVTSFEQPLTAFRGPNPKLFLVKRGKRYYFAWEVR